MAKSQVETMLEKKVKTLTKEIEEKTNELKEAQDKLDEFQSFKDKFDYYNNLIAPPKQPKQPRNTSGVKPERKTRVSKKDLIEAKS